jgi:abortive infection alpha-like protein
MAQEDDNLLKAAPGLARMAVVAYLRGLRWGVDAVGRLVGVTDEPPLEHEPAKAEPRDETSAAALRRRGEQLLRLSADVNYEEDSHPAYARILDVMAPDEARILRLLHERGSQPAVDVRSGGPLGVGVVATELVAPGLNMIGAEAGCRHLDRVPAYLNNLYRLGLIWFSREQVGDHLRYQVLEAQPEVVGALDEAGRGARTTRRSIHLTPFGADFCALCIPPTTGEFEALRQSARDDPPPSGDPGPGADAGRTVAGRRGIEEPS